MAAANAQAWVRDFEAAGGYVAWSFGAIHRKEGPGLWTGVSLDQPDSGARARQLLAELQADEELLEAVRLIARVRAGIRAA